MTRITNSFLDLLGINSEEMKEWKPVKESEPIEVIQLLIPLNEVRIL
jgi:hypothetical protein